MSAITDKDIFGYVSLTSTCLDVNKQALIQNIQNEKQRSVLDLHRYVVPSIKRFESNKKKSDQIHDVIFRKQLTTAFQNRIFGVFYGNAIGDALGAPLEFQPVCYENKIYLSSMKPTIRGSLRPGQWTDDTSQALCLADSLIQCKRFDPLDFNLRLLAWWYGGYNNTFRLDSERKSKMSLGLGGNTASALNQFLFQGESYTKAGDKNTSGNGSIMRLSPLAIWFACYCCETGTFNSDIDTALRVARQSSYATHQGNDAAECCALLMMFLVRAIQTGDKLLCFEEIKEFFKTANPRVQCIARSEREDKENDWNWKNKHFKYAEGRVKENPGYVGSYSCDALAMAFHCIWWTNNFHDALIKAVNYRGDADSVGAITGQIAGAIYGFLEIPKEWLDELLIWDDCHIGIRCMILEKRAKRLRQRLYKKKS